MYTLQPDIGLHARWMHGWDTGPDGFLFYFLAAGLISLLLFGKVGGKLDEAAPSPMDVLWNGTMGNLLCYIFWWTYVKATWRGPDLHVPPCYLHMVHIKNHTR